MTYTLYRVHSFECDAPECPKEVEDVSWFKREAWKEFESWGWRRTADGKHYCPQHAGDPPKVRGEQA